MKKIFRVCFTAIFFAGASTSVAFSQDLIVTSKITRRVAPEKNPFQLQSNSARNSRSLYLNEVPSKAIRDFYKEYENAGDAKWWRLNDGNDGFFAWFTNDGIETTVLYDKRGNYDCMFRRYFEDKLSPAVRHRVKTIYYDFDIFHITEVSMNDKTVYVITIEDKTCWKKILVAEGQEIVSMEKISKAERDPGLAN